jgi:hypothetical protein
MKRFHPITPMFAFALALTLAAPARAQLVTPRPSRDWLLADRTLIGDFSHVTSVAAASDRVFVTSPSALLIWRPQFQRWEGPFQPPDPTALGRVFASLVDPLDNSLWLARSDGWVHYQPDLDAWTGGTVGTAVLGIAVDLNAPIQGLLLRTSAGWLAVSRGGFSASPAPPPARPVGPVSVSELLRSTPTLQANSAQILLDPRMRDVRYTAAARAFDQRGWYVGTWGRGLLYLPDGAAIPERLAFGLPGNLVGAVFAAPGGVWAANDRTPDADVAFTFVASDLSDFSTTQGPLATGLPFTQVRHIVGQGTALWAATDYGVARIEPGGRVRLFDEGAGLPDGRVLSLVTRYGQIVAGTARGIVRLDDSMRIRRVAPHFTGAALAVAMSADTVWAGTPAGLLFAAGDSAELSRPGGLDTSSLQAAVIGLEWLGDTLVALTPDQLLWRSPHGAWTLGPSLSGTLGRLRTFRTEGNGFWVAGDRGLAYATLKSPPLRPLLSGDVPGDIYDLAVDPDYLWVATSAGLVRFRLDAIRP